MISGNEIEKELLRLFGLGFLSGAIMAGGLVMILMAR
jgi:hypothetical protein